MFILVMGASGSGTTTLGAALARELSVRHLDTDHYFWMPTSEPYTRVRSAAKRRIRLHNDLRASAGAVVSGSVTGWGPEVEDLYDLIVFLQLPVDIRLQRLRSRDTARLGAANESFLTWAARYDDPDWTEGRTRVRHEAWLATRSCPVLRLVDDESVAERLAHVLAALPGRPDAGAR